MSSDAEDLWLRFEALLQKAADRATKRLDADRERHAAVPPDKDKRNLVYLALRWAQFFNIVNWRWRVSDNPRYDFRIAIPCSHSECPVGHLLHVRIINTASHKTIVSRFNQEFRDPMGTTPIPAIFGDNPENTYWQMVHGDGGGEYNVSNWVRGSGMAWNDAMDWTPPETSNRVVIASMYGETMTVRPLETPSLQMEEKKTSKPH